MKYKQVYDLPEFASLADNRQLLVIKSADTFVAVHADAYGDDDYELGIRNRPLTTSLLLDLEFITRYEADELYAAERERTKGSWRKSELNNLLRLIRKFPEEAAELLLLPTVFEPPLTAEEEAQKRREVELAELGSLMKLVSKYPKDTKEFLSQA